MRAQTKIALLAGLIAAACLPAVVSAQTANRIGSLEDQAQASWRESMAHIATPSEGCFQATYPSVIWHQSACHALQPRVAPVPRFKLFNSGAAQTAGNGNDYTIQTSSLITQAVGSFPSVTGVTSEKGVGVAAYGGGGILGANEYSLQIN